MFFLFVSLSAFCLGLFLYMVTPYMNKIYILETKEKKQQNRRGELVVENSPLMLKIGVRCPVWRVYLIRYIVGSDTLKYFDYKR